MKTAILAAALLLFATSAIASPEVISMKNRVKFPHKDHMAWTGTCRACHDKGPGKIVGFAKEWAHKNCKGCHAELAKGPVKCSGCHKW